MPIPFVQFNSVAQSCQTLCDSIDCSTLGFPVRHQLLGVAQTHVHRIQWWYPTISSSVISFFYCLQSFLSSGSFPISQLFVSDGQSIAVSASASVLPMNIQGCFPLGLTDLIFLESLQGTLKSLLQHHSSITSILWHSAFFTAQLSHPYMITGKTIAMTLWTSVGKEMSLLFNMLSMFVIAFLSRSKRLLISRLLSPSAVIWSPRQ